MTRDQRQTAVDHDVWAELYNPGTPSERLDPGGSAKASLLQFDFVANQWVRLGSSRNDLGLITVHSPHYNSFALQGDRFRVVLNTERNQWEVRQRYGLRRKAEVTKSGGIPEGGAGEVTFHYAGAITDPAQTTTAYYTHGYMGDLPEGKEVYVSFWPDELQWHIEVGGGGAAKRIGVLKNDLDPWSKGQLALYEQTSSGAVPTPKSPEVLVWAFNITTTTLRQGPLMDIVTIADFVDDITFPSQIQECAPTFQPSNNDGM